MRLRALTIALFLMGGLGPATTAHASSLAGVKLAACQSGDQTSDRKATFVGHMRSVSGASQLVMRFQLEEQYGRRSFTRVSAPELRGWRRSRAGVHNYSYSQSVTGLLAGESYRAQVQFRWLDPGGKTVLQARRYSGVCSQAGDLPNLRVLDVLARPGIVAGTEAYTVDVVNAGLAPATHVDLQLVVDGATPDTTTVDSFAPGEIHSIHFTGPGCKHRVRATVDPSDTVHETVEKDNSLVVGCPPQG